MFAWKFPSGLINPALVLLVLTCALTLAAISACGKNQSSTESAPGSTASTASDDGLDAPVATIDGVVITARELKRQIDQQSAPLRARYSSLENKKEFLESLIRFEVLAKEATALKLDKDPEVMQKVKQVMVQKLMRSQAQNSLKPSDVPEQEMRDFYEKNSARYNRPAEVRASTIVTKTIKDAKKVAKLLRESKDKTPKGFNALVSKHSIDSLTKNRGGDLRYFRKDNQTIPRPVVEAAFQLQKIGDLSEPVDAENGKFYIIKLTGKRKAVHKTFDEVKRQIQNQLYRTKRTEKQKEFIAKLKAKAKITIHEDKLAEITINASGNKSPSNNLRPSQSRFKPGVARRIRPPQPVRPTTPQQQLKAPNPSAKPTSTPPAPKKLPSTKQPTTSPKAKQPAGTSQPQ